MKLVMAACAALTVAGCAGVPGMGAMNPAGMAVNSAMANSNAQLQMQGANMMAAQASAQAAAVRPGDEALSCDALQTEMGVMFKDPAFQAAVASAGASAQSQMDRAKAAQASAAGLGVTSAITG